MISLHVYFLFAHICLNSCFEELCERARHNFHSHEKTQNGLKLNIHFQAEYEAILIKTQNLPHLVLILFYFFLLLWWSDHVGDGCAKLPVCLLQGEMW
jgi:hypothetical protein